MRGYGLMLAVLGVWRVTHLLHAELGPWRVLERFRQRTGHVLHTSLLHCFYCLSVWVALPVGLLLGGDGLEKLMLVLASSGGAILLERLTNPAFAALSAPPVYYEGKPNELLPPNSDNPSATSPG
jgi:hypothetical protein